MTGTGCTASTHIWSTLLGTLAANPAQGMIPFPYERLLGSGSILTERPSAYNDILYLCEKYAPYDTPDSYDPGQDLWPSGLLPRRSLEESVIDRDSRGSSCHGSD